MGDPYPIPEKEHPPLRIWEHPNEKHDYVMGIDTGEGLGQEYSVADVYCRQTGCQVAQYITNQQDPEEFAISCVALGTYYNTALTVIETNDSGLTVLVIFRQEDEKTNKPRYRRSRIWRRRTFTKAKTVERSDFGWQTNRNNRRHMIFDLKAGIKRRYIRVRSSDTQAQIRTFVRKKEGRLEHTEGECDDCVFAAALAWQGFKDIAPREIEESRKVEGPTTIGEFVDICRKHDKKHREFIIGRNPYEEEISIILRGK
jgi:hypothetical protein